MSFSDFIHTHCSTMELKAKSVFLLVCVTIIILTSTEVDAGCCLTVSKKIPKRMLASVYKYQIQDKAGPCDIDALVLFTKKRIICADLKVLERMKKLTKMWKRIQIKAE